MSEYFRVSKKVNKNICIVRGWKIQTLLRGTDKIQGMGRRENERYILVLRTTFQI